MGYHTTLTIDNAVVGNILNSPKEFVDKIIRACGGEYYKIGKDEFGLGIDEPFVRLQKPREYHETTVFVFKNGKLLEVNSHSALTNELKEHNPEKYAELINVLQDTLTNLAETVPAPQILTDAPFEFNLKADIINSGESNIIVKDDEALVAQWLKDNKIPMTVAKLKKLNTTKLKK